jgi:uncharacterized protein
MTADAPQLNGHTAAISTEIHAIPVGAGRFLFYAPLRRTAFLGNASMAGLIERLRKTVTGPAAEGAPEGAPVAFLRDIGLIGGPPDVAPRAALDSHPKPTRVSLLLTTACTMRCTYCYASAGDRPVRYMSLATAMRGIDLIARNAVELGVPGIELSFHGGGEPTLNWPVLTGAVQYARECVRRDGLQLRAHMATNGLLALDRLDWVAANLDDLAVSFDGLPQVHDANRRLPDGGPTSQHVLRTLRLLDERGYAYGVRATLMADHIASLPDSMEYLFTACHPSVVQVEPVYRFGRAQGAASVETDEFIDAFRLARERVRKLGGNLVFSPVRIGALTDHFCDATKGSFCLAASGNVTSCYEVFSEDQQWAPKFFFGKPVEGGYRFDEGVLAGLRAQSVHNRSFCRDCFVRWDCGGDCYHKALMTHGDVEFRGAGRCRLIRELAKDALLDKIASSGGTVWRDGPAPKGGAAHGVESRHDSPA